MQDYAGLIYLGVLVIAFYLLIIRPQMQRTKQMRALMASLAVGDRVITIGGMHGTIVEIVDQVVTVRAADGVQLTFEKSAIARRSAAEAAQDAAVDEGGAASDSEGRPSG